MSDREKQISLIMILEILFGDENLHRNEHISYVMTLLHTYWDAIHPNGLQLDHIQFDFDRVNPHFTPPKLKHSRHHKVIKTPVTWYFQSLLNLNNKNNHLILLNILIIKVAIYLLALPQIKPTLFKSEKAKHQNTVMSLFQRFRMTNIVIASEKTYIHRDAYLRLVNKYLNRTDLSLEGWVQHLEKVIKLDSIPKFEKNFLNDMRVALNYVIQGKAKLIKLNTTTRLQYEFIDDEQRLEESLEYHKKGRSQATQLENLIDQNGERQVYADPADVTPFAARFEFSQKYVLYSVVKHIFRKGHNFSSSSHFPNYPNIQCFFNHLYQEYLSNPQQKSAVILLLSFITGNPIHEWLYLQSKRAFNLNQRQKIIFYNQQYFLRTKFNIYENKSISQVEGLLNQTIELDILIPNDLIKSLRDGARIDQKDVLRDLASLRKQMNIPHLSFVKISSLLHHVIYHKTGNKQLADLITGIDTNRSSSISYCHYPVIFLQQTHLDILKSLCSDFTQRIPENAIEFTQNFGNQKAPHPSAVKEFFMVLKFHIFSQAETDWLNIYQYYNLWMWHIMLLFTAARPVNDFPGFLNHIDLDQQLMILSDKEVGGRNGSGRLVPLCPFLVTEIQKFLEFLRFLQKKHLNLSQEFQTCLDKILSSQRPLLNLFHNDEFIPISATLLRKKFPNLQNPHDNWHRHTARSFLTMKVAEPEILALFGHENMQQEAAHPYSSLPLNQYKKISAVLDNMQEQFSITGIELDVIQQ